MNNNTLSSYRPQFAGYRLERDRSDGEARLFLPGHAPGSGEPPRVEVLLPGGKDVQPMPLRWNAAGDVWESAKPVPPDTAYRFIVDGYPRLDLLESIELPQGEFNRVARNSAHAPTRSVVMLDAYLDSLVSRSRFDDLKKQNGDRIPVRNQFNRFSPPEGSWPGLSEALSVLQEGGFRGLLLKPFIGGDNLSTHRYWTVDPYRLNDTFQNKAEFRSVLNTLLKNGMKLYADGAFVNQGLNGVQMLSNLNHGHRSPYWNWFRYGQPDDLNAEAGAKPLNPLASRWDYPPQASENYKQTFGVLPTKFDPKTGHRTLDFSRFAIAFENNPLQHGYQDDRPTFIRLYDPQREDEKGHSRSQDRQSAIRLTDNSASVHSYRFPISAAEARDKQKELIGLSESEQKARLTEWGRFRLSGAHADDSGMKWDGNIPVALLNSQNPEVRQYLQGAVTYWSRMVMNTHIDTVARELAPAIRVQSHGKEPTSDEIGRAISAITSRAGVKADRSDPHRVLPPVTLPDLEMLSKNEIQNAMAQVQEESARYKSRPESEKRDGLALASAILEEIPLSVLSVPDVFKGTLSMPELAETLQQGRHPHWRQAIKTLFSVVVGDSSFGRLMASVRDWLAPPSFVEQLGQRLQSALASLPASEAQKLAHADIRSLLADQWGESILLHLLTGLDPVQLAKNAKTSTSVEEAFYQTVPPFVRDVNPVAGVRHLEGFLRKQLQKEDSFLEPRSLGKLLNGTLAPLDPLSVRVATAVLQKREYGLNWRIDAAKEVSDMDRVRNASSSSERLSLFHKEMSWMQKFWNEMGPAMRTLFPKSAIIAELTDLHKLSDVPTEKTWLNKLFSENTFTSTPNMSRLYSQLMELVNYAQRPDEFGGNQMSPEKFVETVIRPLSQSLPVTALNQLQNMVSSHDYNTASHALMVNPALFNMDLLRWWGLKDDFLVACGELGSKACFQDKLARLQPQSLPNGITMNEVLENLTNLPADFHARLQHNLPADLRQFYDESAKKPRESDDRTLTDSSRYIPTPKELKGRFVDAFFDALTVADRRQLGLLPPSKTASASEKAFEANLKQVLKERMLEPSEAKAMRGVIVNSVLALHPDSETGVEPNFWESAKTHYKLDDATVEKLQNAVESDLWRAMDKTVAEWGRHFGYQSPDIALQHVFDNLGDDWKRTVPAFQKHPEQARAFRQSLQNALYAEALRPVMPKMLRIFAVQNALPGNPSVYLPDWFVQGGGEWTQNVFSQNRSLINIEKLKPSNADSETASTHSADYQRFMERAGAIFRTRSAGIAVPGKDGELVSVGPGALNDGVLLDVPADDENGVLPIVRDNGQEQVITLVYTGKPQPLDWQHKEGYGPGYETVQTENGPLLNYETRLESPELVSGRIYRDAMDGERFRLDEHGALRSLSKPDHGIDIADCRILVREPK